MAVCQLAVRWRQTFHRDCVVDIVCFRRHGHNELDDPRSTQPLTYRLIDQHPRLLDTYVDRLLKSGTFWYFRNPLYDWSRYDHSGAGG